MKKKLYDLFLVLNALSFLLYICVIFKYYEELYKHTDGKLILFLLIIGLINSIIRIKEN